MPECDTIRVMALRKSKMEELMRIAHGRKEAWAFCIKVGIDSVRNLEVYLKKMGVWDGHVWTYGELAKDYGFSRPRAAQVCQRTERLLQAYYADAAKKH